MRILVLAHNLTVAGGRSVGVNILTQIGELVGRRHEVLAIVAPGADYQAACAEKMEVLTASFRSLPSRLAFEFLQLPRITRAFKPDRIWALGNIGLRRPPCPQAILCHDAHLVYPRRHYALEPARYRAKKQLLKLRLKACLPRTDIVFCQTNVMRHRFREEFEYKGRLELCPNAVSQAAVKSPDDDALPDDLAGLGDRFKLLVLTKYYAHKNLEGLVDMYARHGKSLRDTVCILTIDASQHRLAGPLLNRIRREGLESSFVNVGPIPQETLGRYYRACDALLLPTLMESFSGTYLEAMHFRRPIVTSDLDFAREICRDAASYFDPWNPAAIADSVKSLRDSQPRRKELVANGTRRLEECFLDWDEIICNALDILGIDHK